jgi:hypothetical protein
LPPVPMPGPDAATYDRGDLPEIELDCAAAAKPNPGDLPNLHRLTRTEYSNAIRDLLLGRSSQGDGLHPPAAGRQYPAASTILPICRTSPATMALSGRVHQDQPPGCGDLSMPLMVNIHHRRRRAAGCAGEDLLWDARWNGFAAIFR